MLSKAVDIEEFIHNEAVASVGLDASAHVWDSKDAIKAYQNNLESIMRRLRARQGEDWVKLHNTKDMRLYMRLVYQEAAPVKKKSVVAKKTLPVAMMRAGKKGGKAAKGANIANRVVSFGNNSISESQTQAQPMSQDGNLGDSLMTDTMGTEEAADVDFFDMDVDDTSNSAFSSGAYNVSSNSGSNSDARGSGGGASKVFDGFLFDEAEDDRAAGQAGSSSSSSSGINNSSSGLGRPTALHKNISTTTFANEVMAEGTPIYMPSSISTYDLSSYNSGGHYGGQGDSTSPMYGSGDEFMFGGSMSPPPPPLGGDMGSSSTSPTNIPPPAGVSAEDVQRRRLEEQREREKRELQAMKHVDLDKNRRIMMDAWDEF